MIRVHTDNIGNKNRKGDNMDVPMTITVFLIVTVEIAIMMPFWRYLTKGWAAKRKDIMDGLSNEACHAYFTMFRRNCEVPSTGNGCVEFSNMYNTWYGRNRYYAPGLLLFAVSLIAVMPIIFTVMKTLNFVTNPFFDVPVIAISALAGAYMWVMDDLISRSRRLDLAPSDIQWCVLRLIVSIPMGYAFATIAAKDIGPFIAFAMGAFPFTTLTSMLRRITNRGLNLDPKDDEASDDIVKLQGIDRAIVERLANEDIRTVTQVAYCDPVHITMRSNLNFNFVTDCMGQALAWLYLQDNLEKLRPLGLRGAVEIKYFIDEYNYNGTDPERLANHKIAVSSLPIIASAINQDPATVLLMFRQIEGDPYTAFLYEIWT